MKRALLIGVSGYTAHVRMDEPPWKELHTDKDVAAIEQVLVYRFGFSANQITKLTTPKQTEKKAILDALKALAHATEPGDIVYIHYSGHGDTTPSGLQTLVPSDWFNPTDRTDNLRSRHITSRELAEHVTTIKRKLLGGDPDREISLTLVFDCCYSGHLLADVRGEHGPQVRGRNEKASGSKPRVAPQAPQAPEVLPSEVFSKTLGLTAFYACRYNEKAIEVTVEADKPGGTSTIHGHLTYALIEALKKATPATTHGDILADIQARILVENPMQHPQLTGKPEKALFRGTALPAPRGFAVKPEGRGVSAQVFVEAGQFQFITPRTSFALYPRTDRQARGRSVGEATVLRVEASRSLVKVKTEGGFRAPETLGQLQAVPFRPYGDRPLRLTLDGGGLSTAERRRFEQILRELGPDALVALGTRAEATLELVKAPGGFDIRRIGTTGETGRISSFAADGSPKPPPTIPDGQLSTQQQILLEVTNRTARVVLLRGLGTAKTRSSEKSTISIQVRMVPALVRPTDPSRPVGYGNATFVADRPEGVAGKEDWKLGEWYTVEVRNGGTEACYTTVLDIDAHGWITGLYPELDREPRPLHSTDGWRKLERAGRELTFAVGLPVGQSTLHVIAQPTRIDPGNPRALIDGITDPDVQRGLTASIASVRSLARASQSPIGKFLVSLLRFSKQGTRDNSILLSDDLDIAVVPYRIGL